MLGGSRQPLRLTAALALLASAGCSDEPTGPPADEASATVEVVAGDGQTGAAGQLLPGPVRVRVVGDDGLPLVDEPLTLHPEPPGSRLGPADLRTDRAGRATFRWWLAPSTGAQTVRVAQSGTGSAAAASAEVEATAVAFPDVDRVTVEEWPDEAPIGALVDGRASVGDVDDFRFVGRGPTLGLGDWRGDVTAGTGTVGEVTIFRPGGAFVHRSPAGFTPGADTLHFPDETLDSLELTVWLATGGRARVETALLTAARIFEEEGLGATVGSVEVVEDVDLTQDLLSFTCPEREALEAAAGRRDDRINIYVVTEVDDHTTRGQACEIGGSFIALGEFAGATLLAHEIGHNLSLLHVDGRRDHFGPTNLMHSASDTRAGLTEGQIVRARLNATSVLNATFDHGGSGADRACYFHDDDVCPPLHLRLWGDGEFGPWPTGVPADVAAGVPGSTAPTPRRPLPVATCALDGAERSAGPPGPVPPGRTGDPPAATHELPDAPEGWRVSVTRRAAAARAEANARWLARRGGPPAWLETVPAEAIDPGVAAEVAEERLGRVWRGWAHTRREGDAAAGRR